MKKLWLTITVLVLLAVLDSLPNSATPQTLGEDLAPVFEVDAVEAKLPELISIKTSSGSFYQGDPVLFELSGVKELSEVKEVTFNGVELVPFIQNGVAMSLVGLDLHLEPKRYGVKLALSDGRVATSSLLVLERKVPTAPLGIPDSLGGNSATSTDELIKTLAQEAKVINGIRTRPAKLWTESFGYPTAKPLVTDTYGYGRETNGVILAHKGTDFRAPVGTNVYSINAGRVAYTGFLRNYGNLVAVDHGAGALSIYMHLSKIFVTSGQMLKKGELLGLSGDTGYVLGPHLHLTMRLNGVSIDPMKFIKLF